VADFFIGIDLYLAFEPVDRVFNFADFTDGLVDAIDLELETLFSLRKLIYVLDIPSSHIFNKHPPANWKGNR